MDNLKIQIILFYYDRPNFIRRMALKTVFESDYDNWELAIIDDSNDQNTDDIVESFCEENPHLSAKKNNVKIFKTNDTLEEKKKRGDSIFGKFANDAIHESDADISLMLCDDDGIVKDYLSKLNAYYLDNKDVAYSFCRVVVYNPETDRELGKIPHFERRGFGHEDINFRGGSVASGHNVLDCSQVSWRRDRFLKDNLAF